MAYSDKEEQSYNEWLNNIYEDPSSSGAKGCALALAALPAALCLTMLGASIFPQGLYPIIILMIPGFILSWIFIYIYGWVAWKMPSFISVLLSLAVAVGGVWLSIKYIEALWHIKIL